MATIPSVAANELIRTSWGNAVALELNTRCVKVDASTPITGSLIVTGAPSLKLRRTGDAPYLQFESTTGTPFGYLQGTLGSLVHQVNSATGIHTFRVGSAEVGRFDPGGLDVVGGITATASIVSSNQVRGVQGRFGNTGTQPQLVIADTAGGAASALANVSFYPAATSLDALGTRAAYVGYSGEGFQVSVAGAAVVQASTNLVLESGDDLIIHVNGADRFFVKNTAFLFGKTASNLDLTGVELYGVGSGAIGSIRSTTGVAGIQNWYARHMGAADASGQNFALFTRGASAVVIGSITQSGTNGTAFNESSDYRLKHDRGPIVAAVERLRLLKPRRFAWRDDPDVDERDGFMAHEVTPAVPEAVTGAKDAVAGAGEIVPQQLDASRLVPLLVAAVQEIDARLADLEAEAAA